MFNRLFAAIFLLLSFGAFASDEADQAIHTELRGVLSGLEQAVNNEKYDDIAAFFHENLHVTTINQEVISSRPEISAYFKKWFGANGYLRKVHMTLTADKLTELYGDKTYGIDWLRR